MHTSSAAFGAITDPTRRGILDRLRGGPASVNELVDCFEVTQSAVSQHLRVLRDAGLVHVEQRGRHRLYSLQAEPLEPVFDWVAQYEAFWSEKLTQLGQHLRKSKR